MKRVELPLTMKYPRIAKSNSRNILRTGRNTATLARIKSLSRFVMPIKLKTRMNNIDFSLTNKEAILKLSSNKKDTTTTSNNLDSCIKDRDDNEVLKKFGKVAWPIMESSLSEKKKGKLKQILDRDVLKESVIKKDRALQQELNHKRNMVKQLEKVLETIKIENNAMIEYFKFILNNKIKHEKQSSAANQPTPIFIKSLG